MSAPRGASSSGLAVGWARRTTSRRSGSGSRPVAYAARLAPSCRAGVLWLGMLGNSQRQARSWGGVEDAGAAAGVDALQVEGGGLDLEEGVEDRVLLRQAAKFVLGEGGFGEAHEAVAELVAVAACDGEDGAALLDELAELVDLLLGKCGEVAAVEVEDGGGEPAFEVFVEGDEFPGGGCAEAVGDEGGEVVEVVAGEVPPTVAAPLELVEEDGSVALCQE